VKKLDRLPPPGCLATDTEEGAQAQRDRYADLRYPSGAWRSGWNQLDKDETQVSAPRRTLLLMSAGECAYCGLWISNAAMEVDHILPKEAFPFLAYAWDNLLPACRPCNGRKLAFVPRSLQGKRVVEECVSATVPHDRIFDKRRLFSEEARDDRLVDPSFDDPAEHIELLMDTPSYRPKSPIGELTYARFFRRREVAEELVKVRDAARDFVRDESPPHLVEHCARLNRHPSLFLRFIDYWNTEKREGRWAAWERADAIAANTPAS